MLFEGDYYSPSELFSCMNDGTSSMMMTMKNRKMINKRRFSDEQVKSLESIFENETKLEPKKKVQLARELGLEPRQVAIWFQNKRARYKSRQLERDYTILQSNYDSLASHFDALKKEKQALLSQLQKLKELAEKDENNKKNKKSKKEEEESSNKSSESESEKRQYDQQEWEEVQNKPTNSLSLEGSEYGTSSIMSSDEGSSGGNANAHYLVKGTGEMDMEILAAMVSEPVVTECESVTVPSESGWDDGLRPDEGLFDGDSCGQWWDFWS